LATTKAEIIETPDEREPFRVVFSKDGLIIAEMPINSWLSGEELIESLLPILRKHENA
jgi:hypothetical protein